MIRAAVSVAMQPRLYGLSLGPLIARSTRLHNTLHPSHPPDSYTFAPTDRAPFQPFMAATVGRQLAGLERTITARRAHIARVRTVVDGLERVAPLDMDRHGRANGGYFGVRVEDAQAAADHLARQGVETQVRPFQDGSTVGRFGGRGAPCPVAAAADRTVLRLPNSPALRTTDMDRVARGLADA